MVGYRVLEALEHKSIKGITTSIPSPYLHATYYQDSRGVSRKGFQKGYIVISGYPGYPIRGPFLGPPIGVG